MSNFYGNILKHFQEAFSSFGFRNSDAQPSNDIIVDAKNTKEKIIIKTGDRWLNFSGSKNNNSPDIENIYDSVVTLSHSDPNVGEEDINDSGVTLKVINPDLSSHDGTTEITLFSPSKDRKGHLNGAHLFEVPINLNINTEINERTEADNALGNKIDEEIQDRTNADNALGIRINDEATTRETTDKDHNKRLVNIETRIKGLTGAMHFIGVEEKIPEGEALKNYNDGDVIVVGNKEYVFKTGKNFIELGDTTEENKKINALENALDDPDIGIKKRLDTIEGDSIGSIKESLQQAKSYTDGKIQDQNIIIKGINTQVEKNVKDIKDITDNTTGILAQAKKYSKDYTDQLANGQVLNNTSAINTINDPKTGLLEQANSYARKLKYKNMDFSKDIAFKHELTPDMILKLSFIPTQQNIKPQS